jgi:diguanylate cyclase
MAAATALFVPVALAFTYGIGYVELAVALRCSALVLGLIGLFYGLIRSGLNLRFADPSLTAEMIGASTLLLGWIMYEAPSLRDSLILFYAVTLLFGVFRLATRRLMELALLALATHASVVVFSYLRHPQQDLHMAAIQYAVLAGVLPWFGLMGGYVNQLRHRLSDSNRQLKVAYGRIEQIAVRDELTGVYNRRFLLEVLGREHARALRLGSTFLVCMIDIDHFKSVNDTLGHGAGDAVLRQFAKIAADGLRAVDVLGRYGGEEFLLILPDTDGTGACTAAERVRSAIEAATFAQLPTDRRVTVTIGVAASRVGESVQDLLGRADGALYKGKADGRNRVVAVG